MPDFLNGWAMLTSGTPFSRAASAPPIQSTITSAPPPAITCSGAMSGPPGLIVDVEVFLLVEALVLGDVVAGELRLRDPFQLQRHLVGAPAPGSAASANAPRQQCQRSVFFIVPSVFPLELTPVHHGQTDART